MRMTRDELLHWDHKAISLLGMSGVGKTTLASKLSRSEWYHYSGDYRIGSRYMGEAILDNIKLQAMQVDFLRELLRSDSIYIGSRITAHNLTPLSMYLGKIGNPALGGLALDEFSTRQRQHETAEILAMRDVGAFIEKARGIYGYPHFLNDAGGSICELGDEATLQHLAEQTLVIYIRADTDMEETLIKRQSEFPKPLYYSEDFLLARLEEYLASHGVNDITDIEPDKFVQWIFPLLVAYRRPRYEAIARRYGYTVHARNAETVRDEQDLMALLGDALEEGNRRPPSGD